MKIGVVTDVGTVNDKNFNEYTFVGAKDGAAAIGAEEPPVVVPKDASEYPTLIQKLVDEGTQIIVTAGFDLGVETTKAANDNPDVWFIGVDQGPPCMTPKACPTRSSPARAMQRPCCRSTSPSATRRTRRATWPA